MNKILLLIGLFFFSLPLQAQVEVCEDDDANEASCTTLEYDVDDLDDFNDEGKDLGDEISHITIDPYTSVVLYKDKYFDEENIVYTIPATSSGDTLDKEELKSLGLHDEISSIKVHPREITNCNSDTFIDDCLMEVAKPTLVYDEGTPECNDRFREGEDGFRSGVQTTDDGNYKIVFYEIYHKADCGAPGLVGVAEAILDTLDTANTTEFSIGHEGDKEVAKFAFQKIADNGETYWALVVSRYQHHTCTTDKQLEEITWPLRIYISESKHAQYTSYWECEEWGLNDVSDCEDGTWTEISDDDFWDADWIQEYEDCDYWPRSLTSDADTASDGGEILYPEEYGLVDGSFPSESTDWFSDSITLDEAGLLVLQPTEEDEEPDESTTDDASGDTIVYGNDATTSNQLSCSNDTGEPTYQDQLSGDEDSLVASCSGSLTMNNFTLESGDTISATAWDSLSLSAFTLKSGSRATFVAYDSSLTANDFTIDGRATFYASDDLSLSDFTVGPGAIVGVASSNKIILSPSFHVQRGAYFVVAVD